MPEADALKIIREESGQHFDPVVVECFLNHTDEIREIYRQYKEDKTSGSFLRSILEGKVPI
jgi:response regulator RpfG family c-di-GMP phosphodiesterase